MTVGSTLNFCLMLARRADTAVGDFVQSNAQRKENYVTALLNGNSLIGANTKVNE